MNKNNNGEPQKRIKVVNADSMPKEGYLGIGAPCHNIGLVRLRWDARQRVVIITCGECGEPAGALALDSKIKPINRGLVIP